MAIGLGRSKGRLRRGYDADVLIVGDDLAVDLTALRDVRQVVLRGVPGVATVGAVPKRLTAVLIQAHTVDPVDDLGLDGDMWLWANEVIVPALE